MLADLVVLDTHVVLDLWFFEDSACAPLLTALTQGHLRWAACQSMLDELDRVLLYPAILKWPRDHSRLTYARTHFLQLLPDPADKAPWSCRDPDDQKFLDLAHAQSIALLLSKDKALLQVARRAKKSSGLEILRPEAWGMRGLGSSGGHRSS
jgi:putative PIN family toxin of toxin-antitoxin system